MTLDSKLQASLFKESNLQPSQSFAMASTQTQSLLLFSTSQSHKRRKMRKPVPGDFGSQKLSQVSSSRASSYESQGQPSALIVSLVRDRGL